MSKQNTSSKKKSRKRNQAPSHNTKKKLIQFFIKTAELQRKLQIIKEMLAQEPQFTPTSLFHRFDAARKKFITQKDIQDFLNDSGINFKGSQLKTLFGRIDVNLNQSICPRQFQNFILPNQNPQLRYEVVRRPVIIPRPHQKLNQKIEWIVSRFFTQIIKQYTKLSQYNTSLVNSYDFDADIAFDILSNQKGQITGKTIDAFMRQNNQQLSTQQVGCLIKLIDKKGQAKIHRGDFKTYLATLNLKKQHQIFDQLSPIPALKDFNTEYIQKAIKQRDRTLKQRYKDNKSYVKGMDDGHHIMGYSRYLDSSVQNKSWLFGSGSRN